MDQGPSAAFVGPNTARHEHHGTWWTCLGTFWTGSWFSWLGSKDFGSMRSCTHHLIICNRGLDKTNASSSTQLTHCPRERHYLLSHPGEPCRSTLASKASLGCFLVLHSKQQKTQNRIKTATPSRIFTWETGPKWATFSLYVSSPEQGEPLWAWTGEHSHSLQCHLTNLLVQACIYF